MPKLHRRHPYRNTLVDGVIHHEADNYAPHQPESRLRASPRVGPQSPAEWRAAMLEMYANDPEFRLWQDAERGRVG